MRKQGNRTEKIQPRNSKQDPFWGPKYTLIPLDLTASQQAHSTYKYKEYGTTVYVPSLELGPNHPLSRKRVCPPPGSSEPQGGTLACERGDGGVPIPTTTLPTLCKQVTIPVLLSPGRLQSSWTICIITRCRSDSWPVNKEL